MPQVVLGADAGGARWFLEGEPVHAGDGLDLRLPGDDRGERWTPVRFETRWRPASGGRGPDEPQAVLYLYVGHPWEHRFQVVDAEAVPATRAGNRGRWAIYDRRRERVALTSERAPVDEHGDARLVYPDLEADTYASRAAAERAAGALQAAMEWFPELEIPLADPSRVELRWPRRPADEDAPL